MTRWIAWSLVLSTWLCGCVEHRAAIDPPASSAPAAVIDNRNYQPHFKNAIELSSGLPVELRATAWHRLPDGTLTRGSSHVQTPRKWWQRFPVDVFTDLLWPGTLVIEERTIMTLHPLDEISSKDLENAAISAGYGGQTATLHEDDENDGSLLGP